MPQAVLLNCRLGSKRLVAGLCKVGELPEQLLVNL